VAVGGPEVLVDGGVKVATAVVGPDTVLVGVSDNTAGKVGGRDSIPPSGASTKPAIPKQ